jgi:hypothetical protein
MSDDTMGGDGDRPCGIIHVPDIQTTPVTTCNTLTFSDALGLKANARAFLWE